MTAVSANGTLTETFITEVPYFCRSNPRDGDSDAKENLPLPVDGGLAYRHPVLPDPTV